ncbi:hypothetical protein Y032_0463g1904 [Ancylostoma ceylanicum]|uniref:Uncharacterized protein n=1 Tax=Ancylostoma ceylanicum TaxID=53326 RepID=A0A016WZA4_9BILA|nr:hypothetical protein Y032_0463g1904 [Ancylostoma ceylanicum]
MVTNTFIAEVIRINRTGYKYEGFRNRIVDLCTVSVENGWTSSAIVRTLCHSFRNRPIIMRKCGFKCVVHFPLIQEVRRRLLALTTTM